VSAPPPPRPNVRILSTLLAWLCAAVVAAASPTEREGIPEGFVDVATAIPSLPVDLRYATENNFVGTVIDGYQSARPLLTREAAEALRCVQSDLESAGFSLLLLDAYRPQRAVAHFVRWSRSAEPTPHQARHHPGIPKRELFARGYLALESSHSRGSAVDVTLLQRGPNDEWLEVDMGTIYDFFGPEAHLDFPGLSPQQLANRRHLRDAMARHGFKCYDREWWHFELRGEPYPETYFDFPLP
jgi:zinc D-Ala-D-Ala dipeptidase